MTDKLEQLNILGIDYIYIILSHDTQSPEILLIEEAFVNFEEAEKIAREHEKDNNYQFYTTIHRIKLV